MNHLYTGLVLVGISLLLITCQSSPQDVTARGYRYEMHIDEPGPVPLVGEYAYFHITMRTGDSIINSSQGMDPLPRIRIPEATELTPQTSAFIDGLALMSVGDSMTLYFPLDSLPTRPPGFAGIDILEYDLAMKEIKTDAEFKREQQIFMAEREKERAAAAARQEEVAQFANDQLDAFNRGNLDNVQETSDGLKYVIHAQGEGRKGEVGRQTSVQYYGMLMENGEVFDQSFDDGVPYTFPVGRGQVIKGWDVGIPLLNKGGKASLFIPYDMAYGADGRPGIPPKADLYFYVELQDVN